MVESRYVSVEEVIGGLLPMFLEDTREKTVKIRELVEDLRNREVQRKLIDPIMREVHSIKGMATTFGFPFVAVICHKFEEYLVKTTSFSGIEIASMRVFIDEIERILDHEADPSDQAGFEIFKKLPIPVDLVNFSLSQKLIDSLFIGPRDVQFLIIEKQLKACGIRSTNAPRAFQGLELAYRTRPDFIMVSNVIDSISGFEVINMLRALKSLRSIPIMFVTNELDYASQRGRLAGHLPPAVRIVRKGEHFPNDFADALTASNIL